MFRNTNLSKGRLIALIDEALRQNQCKEVIERLQWILHYCETGSASAVCRRFNIARSTFYRWYNRFDSSDFTSLKDHPTTLIKPRGSIQNINEQTSKRVNVQTLLIAILLTVNIVIFLFAIPTLASAASSWNPTRLVNTEAFQIIDDDDTSSNVVLKFGDTLDEKLTYNRTAIRFEFTKNLRVGGNLTATGAIAASGAITSEGALSGASLHISGATSLSGSLSVEGTSRFQSATDSATFFQVNDADGGNPVFNVDTASEYVGIGTASPVFNEDSADVDFRIEGNNNANLVTVDAGNDYVGIGTVPESHLHVKGLNVEARIEASNGNGDAGISLFSDRDWKIINHGVGSAATADSIIFWDDTSGLARFVFDPSGNLGIGDKTPSTKLEVAGTMSGNALNVMAGADSYILGNVGIGTTAPQNKLEVMGSMSGQRLNVTPTSASETGAVFIDINLNATGTLIDSESTNSPALAIDILSKTGAAPHILFGYGGTFDTNLYRSAADTLATDDSIVISGNAGIGTSTAPTANGSKVLYFGDNTANPTMGNNTAGIFGKNVTTTVEMFAVDEAGNAAQISSHNFSLFTPEQADEYPFSLYFVNPYLGIERNVDLSGVVREVEALSGKKFIFDKDTNTVEWDDVQNENEIKYNKAKLDESVAKNLQKTKEIPAEEAFETVTVTGSVTETVTQTYTGTVLETVTVPMDEAFELIEITEQVQTGTGTVYEYSISGSTVTITGKEVRLFEEKGTGKFVKRLKTGISFDASSGLFKEEITKAVELTKGVPQDYTRLKGNVWEKDGRYYRFYTQEEALNEAVIPPFEKENPPQWLKQRIDNKKAGGGKGKK